MKKTREAKEKIEVLKTTSNQKNIPKIKCREMLQRYTLPIGLCAAFISISTLSEAANSAGSVGVISEVMTSITNLIKTEGKIGLQILSAAAGGLAAAKTVSWQPLLVGAGGAGIIEVLFQAIK